MKVMRLAWLFMALLVPAAPAWGQATNSLTIHEAASTTTNNYPVQIGRPFKDGEIAACPQALIDSTPATTQADVKQRWPDGSVKHAILTFHIPTLTADSTVTVTFQNQACDNTGSLNAEGMTSETFGDFDAQISLTNGTTETASARAMIGAGAFTYWMQGPVATSVIVADHSAAGAYDIGFDSYKPFRPIFHATFFPLTGQVRVRFIGEIANTEAIEDMTYDLALKTGFASPATVYSKSSFLHTARSRWTKEFWIGGTPPRVSIDNNLAYLTEAAAVPNYDTSKVVSESVIASAYSSWTGAPHDLGDDNNWQPYMPNTGGRPDIGPLPRWTARWLYTGDWRMREKAFGLADLAARWPNHYREGDTAKWFDAPTDSVPGIGKIISIRARPSLALAVGAEYSGTDADDRIVAVGSKTTDGWTYQTAHLPEPFAPQYLLSGDFWYLEEMWFWNANAAAYPDGTATGSAWGRGPTGAEGVMYGEVRAEAWTLRSRAEVAYASPDGLDETTYFNDLMDEGLADFEGQHGITGAYGAGNAIWDWSYGNKYSTPGGNPNRGGSPLHLWARSGGEDAGLNHSIECGGGSPWMYHYLIYAVGRAVQLGYPFDDVLAWTAVYFTGVIVDPVAGTVPNPDFNPYLISNYRYPSLRCSDGDWFQSWAEMLTAYYGGSDDPPGGDQDYLEGDTDTIGGRAFIALATASVVAGETHGQAAWDWISAQILGYAGLNDNPMWAIVPADFAQPPPVVSLASPSQSFDEDGSAATVTVESTGAASAGAITGPYTLGGTATYDQDADDVCDTGDDYLVSPHDEVTISVGTSTADITLSPCNDATDEGNETVTVQLGTPTGADSPTLGNPNLHTATVIDDDAVVLVDFASASAQVDENTGQITLTVNLSKAAGSDVTVPYTLGGTATAATADAITGINFDTGTINTLASGSDNWPITWADDDKQYTSWGDGTGFEAGGGGGNPGMGVGVVTGNKDDYTGADLWTTTSGKSYGILSLGGDLYMWLYPGSGASSLVQSELYKSTDHGVNFATTGVVFDGGTGGVGICTFLQAGQDYGDAEDGNVYAYCFGIDDENSWEVQPSGEIFAARVAVASIETQGSWTWCTNLDGNGTCDTWGAIGSAVPVFSDAANGVMRTSVIYDVGLDLYILATQQNSRFFPAARVGMYYSPTPTGPWTQFYYGDPRTVGIKNGNATKTTYFNLSPKWMSTDGLTGVMVYTGPGDDQWGTVEFTLSAEGSNGDYTIDASPLVIPSGQTSGSIVIDVVDDTDPESDETVVVTMGAPTNATKGSVDEFTLTITDNDGTVPSVGWSAASQAVDEDVVGGQVTFTAQLSGTYTDEVQVSVSRGGTATGGASCTAGVDYVIPSSDPLVVLVGDTTVDLDIDLCDDAVGELDETITATLSSPVNATLGATTVHTATISDDDGGCPAVVTECRIGGIKP